MAGNRALTPKITWGSGYANTLIFNFWLDSAVAYSDPVEGSEVIIVSDETTWAQLLGHEQFLAGYVRRIPRADRVVGARTLTGWTGATGWEAFLEYARDLQAFRYYYSEDAGSYFDAELVEPMTDEPEIENDSSRRIRLVMRNTARTAVTGY